MKSDRSIRNICIAAIKRKTTQPISFPFTTTFETESMSAISAGISSMFNVEGNELPIAQTFIDTMNWSLITTKRVISSINGNVQIAFAHKIDRPGIGETLKEINTKQLRLVILKWTIRTYSKFK